MDAPIDAEALAALFLQPRTLEAPSAVWRLMRDQHPVLPARLPGLEAPVFFVTRRADIEFVTSHPELFSSRHDPAVYRWGALGPEFDPVFAQGGTRLPSTLVNTDPPVSVFYRRAVTDALSPARVRTMRPKLEALTDALLDLLPCGTPVDFKSRIAVPLAIDSISHVLGLPQSDREFIYDFTNAVNLVVDPLTPLPEALAAARLFVTAQQYLTPRIEALRAMPTESMLSGIASLRHDEGDLLPMEEALSMAFTVIAAGNETTRNSMVYATCILATRPDIAARLRQHPEGMPNFVEETLRHGSPSGTVPRTAVRDLELGGIAIPAGATLFILWGSGNHDETVTEAPEVFNSARDDVRKHLSFGHGPHHCAGVHLARAEIETVVSRLLSRYESISVPEEWTGPVFEPSFHVRQIRELPIILRCREA